MISLLTMVLIPYSNTIEDNYDTFPAASGKEGDTPQYNYTQQYLRNEFANIIVVGNPLNHFSIQLPEHGCRSTRNTTSETANFRKCEAAINAGFFEFKDSACLGNLISDSHVINTCSNMVNFGLLNNGSFIAGYINCETMKNLLDIKQLVSGIGWLVRDSHLFIDQSIKIEKIDPSFVKWKCARVAIGHDKYGRLLMVEVDGDCSATGVDLHQLAKLMIQLGVVNAVNLDGHGSATMITDGTRVRSMCLDRCTHEDLLVPNICSNASAHRCERKVTTIVCIR